jgi:hypothetical protein
MLGETTEENQSRQAGGLSTGQVKRTDYRLFDSGDNPIESSQEVFTVPKAACQFVNVAYILIVTSYALDLFIESTKNNLPESSSAYFTAGIMATQIVSLGVFLGVTAETLQQGLSALLGIERKNRNQFIQGFMGLTLGYSTFALTIQGGGLQFSLTQLSNQLWLGSLAAWLASAVMISVVLFGEKKWSVTALVKKALPPALAFNTFVVLNTLLGVEFAFISMLAGATVSVVMEKAIEMAEHAASNNQAQCNILAFCSR